MPDALEDDGHCFVCGPKNEAGLKLEWKTDGNTASASFVPEKRHQGWKDLAHGGLLAAILDEAMTRLAWQTLGPAVTGEMTVRYLAPARVGERLNVRAALEDGARKLVRARAEITLENGTAVARADAKIILTKAADAASV